MSLKNKNVLVEKDNVRWEKGGGNGLNGIRGDGRSGCNIFLFIGAGAAGSGANRNLLLLGSALDTRVLGFN